MTIPPIASRKVSGRSRINFMPKYFGNGNVLVSLRCERHIFAMADDMIKGYKEECGLWDFYATSNGAGFMAPSMPGKVRVTNCQNYYEGTMSPQAAGLSLSILALNHKSAVVPALYPYWEALMAYAKDHPEAAEIMKFLD